MMRTAIFPGSFDPFTAGHLDVLDSALKLFDKVIVAVGYNSTKTTSGFFPVDIRIKIIKDAVKHYKDRVDVCCYKELTIDLCHRLGVNFIVRGLRTTTDFEFEGVIAQANRVMDPDVVTVYVQASHEYSFISSTVVRDLLVHNGDATPFMPKGVNLKKYLKAKKELGK
ncbi:MAG: pantetheine-phosphate adenylyltransferase [Bacteroidales bacterium]|nr:pantetheine-phosphate adenylyltransferase [Bacteroidales bacterium]MBR5398903.1 pantetheine-phosphate adenylyltransferase [Bacteroidales bacterium]MBR6465431.1 pantetheine-phosphate adenylyltransferase [Bacteroidales bacterium]